MSSDPVQQTQPSSNLQGFYAWTDTLAGVYCPSSLARPQ
jgi:hypothetical protein